MKHILHDLKILDKKIFSRPALWFELVTYSQVDSPVHQVKCAKHYWEDHPEKSYSHSTRQSYKSEKEEGCLNIECVSILLNCLH